MTDAKAFIRTNTVVGHAALTPDIALHLATEITPIWQATEAWLQREGIEPPFWAFAWPGSEALARHVLDNPALVAGRRVLDFASGCGLAAIACARAGAAIVEAAEIDPLAVAAIRLNAALNRAAVTALAGDVVGEACRWDVILCGDVCYEAPMTRHILPWLRRMAATAEGDRGRSGPRLRPARRVRGLGRLQRAYDGGTGGSHDAICRAVPVAAWIRSTGWLAASHRPVQATGVSIVYAVSALNGTDPAPSEPVPGVPGAFLMLPQGHGATADQDRRRRVDRIVAWRSRLADKYRSQLGEELTWDESSAFSLSEQPLPQAILMLAYLAAVLDQKGPDAARSLRLSPPPPILR